MRRVLLLLALLANPALAGRGKTKGAAAPPPSAAPSAPAAKGPAAPDAPDLAPEPAPGVTHPEGEYGGVIPGQPRKQEPSKRPTRPPPKGTLSWIGFEPKSGGAEVFFQSIAPFELAQRVEGGTLVVNLSGLSRLGQNTWRPIDAHFFDTPLSKITARKVGAVRGKNAHAAGIEVRIAFKNAKDAKEGAVRTATEADGFYYVYLDWTGGGAADTGTMQEPEK
jgi:hypothetical protein